MSTFDSDDPRLMRASLARYREGAPARDDEERAAFREWSELDADYRQSAYEEFWGADQAYEQYDGPLSFDAFLSEYRRDQDLASLGIERQELPPPYASALGEERGERLQREIEDARAQLTVVPRDREHRAARTGQLMAARRALNVSLGEQVVGLERQRDELRERLTDAHRDALDMESGMDTLPEGPERDRLGAEATARTAEVDGFRQQLGRVDQELHVLSGREDHPDRWLELHGQEVADALAERQQLEHERALAAAAHEQQAGLEASREATTGIEEHQRLALDRDAGGAGMGVD